MCSGTLSLSLSEIRGRAKSTRTIDGKKIAAESHSHQFTPLRRFPPHDRGHAA
jgi:hypothetical protein